jgi:hypothetical protein
MERTPVKDNVRRLGVERRHPARQRRQHRLGGIEARLEAEESRQIASDPGARLHRQALDTSMGTSRADAVRVSRLREVFIRGRRNGLRGAERPANPGLAP